METPKLLLSMQQAINALKSAFTVSGLVTVSDGNTLYPRSFRAASTCLEDLEHFP